MTAAHGTPAPAGRRRRLTTGAVVVGTIGLLLAIGFMAWAFSWLAHQNAVLQRNQTALSLALDQTRTQLQAHGVTPNTPPAAKVIQGAPGTPGAAGQSIVGPSGPPGKDGVSPDPQAIAALVATMIHPSPGPSGPPGKDSTVPGPQGIPGPASTVAGPQGAKGDPGKDSTVPGPSGQPGANGQPAVGWVFTDGQGDTQDCERAPNFDPNAPRYDCTITSRPSPSPTPSPPSPSPSASASAASFRQQSTQRAPASAVGTGPREI